MVFDVIVDVTHRPGIADPAGATIERALGVLGYPNASSVRVGKSISFSVDADDENAVSAQVAEMCERFLTNPVIEDSSIRRIEKRV